MIPGASGSTKRKDVIEMTDLTAMYKVLSTEDLERLRQESKKQGVNIRGLYAGAASAQNISNADRQYLPPEMGGFKSNIGIYGDKVSLVTFAGKMYSIIIEDPTLTRAMRLLLELAFKGAQKENEGK